MMKQTSTATIVALVIVALVIATEASLDLSRSTTKHSLMAVAMGRTHIQGCLTLDAQLEDMTPIVNLCTEISDTAQDEKASGEAEEKKPMKSLNRNVAKAVADQVGAFVKANKDDLGFVADRKAPLLKNAVDFHWAKVVRFFDSNSGLHVGDNCPYLKTCQTLAMTLVGEFHMKNSFQSIVEKKPDVVKTFLSGAKWTKYSLTPAEVTLATTTLQSIFAKKPDLSSTVKLCTWILDQLAPLPGEVVDGDVNKDVQGFISKLKVKVGEDIWAGADAAAKVKSQTSFSTSMTQVVQQQQTCPFLAPCKTTLGANDFVDPAFDFNRMKKMRCPWSDLA